MHVLEYSLFHLPNCNRQSPTYSGSTLWCIDFTMMWNNTYAGEGVLQILSVTHSMTFSHAGQQQRDELPLLSQPDREGEQLTHLMIKPIQPLCFSLSEHYSISNAIMKHLQQSNWQWINLQNIHSSCSSTPEKQTAQTKNRWKI